MSVSRFALYFFALAAGSTFVFASGSSAKNVTTEAAASHEESQMQPTQVSVAVHLAARRAHLKLTQIARAD